MAEWLPRDTPVTGVTFDGETVSGFYAGTHDIVGTPKVLIHAISDTGAGEPDLWYVRPETVREMTDVAPVSAERMATLDTELRGEQTVAMIPDTARTVRDSDQDTWHRIGVTGYWTMFPASTAHGSVATCLLQDFGPFTVVTSEETLSDLSEQLFSLARSLNAVQPPRELLHAAIVHVAVQLRDWA